MKHVTALFIALSIAIIPSTYAKDSPEDLAKRLDEALKKEDFEALLATTWANQPLTAGQMFGLQHMPIQCSSDLVCAVSVKPYSEALIKYEARLLAYRNMEWPIQPEGLININIAARSSKLTSDAKSSAGFNFTHIYALVGNEYKLIIPSYTPAHLATLKATSAQAAVERTLVEIGVRNDQGEYDKEWKSKAMPLPADGGEIGAAFLAHVKALATAVKANDVDTAVTLLDTTGKALLFPIDFDTYKPVPLQRRQRTLRALATDIFTEARVLGGYRLGNDAVLIVEGTNGNGDTVRGAQFMQLFKGKWKHERNDFIRIPKGAS